VTARLKRSPMRSHRVDDANRGTAKTAFREAIAKLSPPHEMPRPCRATVLELAKAVNENCCAAWGRGKAPTATHGDVENPKRTRLLRTRRRPRPRRPCKDAGGSHERADAMTEAVSLN